MITKRKVFIFTEAYIIGAYEKSKMYRQFRNAGLHQEKLARNSTNNVLALTMDWSRETLNWIGSVESKCAKKFFKKLSASGENSKYRRF